MQGIKIGDEFPKTKRELSDALALKPEKVFAIATSMFGNEYHGPITRLPFDKEVVFVGPDFQFNRKFYGTIKWNATHTQLVMK